MYHLDKDRTLAVIRGGVDVDAPGELESFFNGAHPDRSSADKASVFMRIYARWAQEYMARSGATAHDFAKVSAKSSVFASRNPHAYLRDAVDEEVVLNSPMIAYPLTRLMCSPFADGAAAIIVVSPKAARRLGVLDFVAVDGLPGGLPQFCGRLLRIIHDDDADIEEVER